MPSIEREAAPRFLSLKAQIVLIIAIIQFAMIESPGSRRESHTRVPGQDRCLSANRRAYAFKHVRLETKNALFE